MSPRTYIIAEMACSHEGQPGLARTIIDAAGRAGADAVQFQIWSVPEIATPKHPDYETLTRIAMSRQEWAGLSMYVRERHPGLQIIACVYGRDTVDFCEDLRVDAYKLHSSDLSNPFLVKYAAQTGKRIDLSVGASTISEIQSAVEWIRGAGNNAIWLMYGYQNFPTPTDAIHLDYMVKLRDLFGLPIGYQDHSDGNSEAAFWLPAAAVGMGVDALEKHITHNRSLKGIDHEAALDPDEFARFVAMVREIEAAKGTGIPRPFSEEEMKYRRYAKKSVVAARDLPAGTALSAQDLMFTRGAEEGLAPDQAERLLGRTTRRAIAAYALIREEDLE